MSRAIPLHRALQCPVTCCLGLQAYRDAENRLQSANEGLCVVHRKLEQLQSVEVEKDALQKVSLFSERTFNHGDRQTTSDTYAFNVRVCTMLVGVHNAGTTHAISGLAMNTPTDRDRASLHIDLYIDTCIIRISTLLLVQVLWCINDLNYTNSASELMFVVRRYLGRSCWRDFCELHLMYVNFISFVSSVFL